MCDKKCEQHHDEHEVQRRILWGVMGIVVIIGAVIFLVWAILQPHKPRFVLEDATVSALSLSGSNFLTSNIQVTLSSRNPNERIGIYYEKLGIYANYRNQQITLATELPKSYQGHKDITIWSPFLYGNSVPMSPYLAATLSEDLTAGAVLVNIKVDGFVKWKVGTWVSGKYRLNVNCPAYMTVGTRNHGITDELRQMAKFKAHRKKGHLGSSLKELLYQFNKNYGMGEVHRPVTDGLPKG